MDERLARYLMSYPELRAIVERALVEMNAAIAELSKPKDPHKDGPSETT